MFPCSGCRRYLKGSETCCPFCDAKQRTTLGGLALAVAMLGASACASDTVSGESNDHDTTTTATETDSTPTDSTQTDTDDSTNDTNEASLSFYAPSDDFAAIEECDPWQQDCPEGEKCVPYGSTGGNWDANKCVPVFGDGDPGDSCNYGGVVEATDDCGATSHCWDVMDVDGMNVGTCTSFCTGGPDDPQCPIGSQCLVTNEGSITLCVDICDPIAQDCDPGLGCYWTWSSDSFNCVFTTQDIPDGEACGFVNDCAPGSYCVAAGLMPSCDDSSCCASYCDLDDPDACPDPELSCAAFFVQGQEPPGLEHVGLCVLPP